MANRDASALKDASGANSRQMAPRHFPLCGSVELDMYKHICTNTQIQKYKNIQIHKYISKQIQLWSKLQIDLTYAIFF